MARTPFHKVITQAVSYTIPESKEAIFKAYARETGEDIFLNGAYFATASQGTSGGSGQAPGPLTAKAGDIISCVAGSTHEVSLVGFLYSVA